MLKWTREAPTQEGHYFIRFKSGFVYTTRVLKRKSKIDGRVILSADDDINVPVAARISVSWAGPIPEPIE